MHKIPVNCLVMVKPMQILQIEADFTFTDEKELNVHL